MFKQLAFITMAMIFCGSLSACQSSRPPELMSQPRARDPLGVGQAINDSARSYGDQISSSIANS